MRFYALRVIVMTEDQDLEIPPELADADDEAKSAAIRTIPMETMVFFQDKLPDPPQSNEELINRFVVAMGFDLTPQDKAEVIGPITDPYALQVLRCWDKVCVDCHLQTLNVSE